MCCCAQLGATELDSLDHLINDEGMDQVTACRLLWGNQRLTLAEELAWASATARRIVRAGLADVIAWLDAAAAATEVAAA